MTRLSRTELKRQLKYLFTLVTVFLTTAGTLFAACSATLKNADYSDVGSGTTATLSTGGGHTMNVASVGDLIVISAWCYKNCNFGTVTLGNQTAARTSVVTPGTTVGVDGLMTGQAAIYYVLSAAAAGNQTISLSVSGGSQIQLSYMDFQPSAGCTFSHHIDSPVGSASGGGTANTPSINGVSGDILFGFVVTTQHVNPSVNSPWSCPIYSGQGETQTCAFPVTVNGAAYILSAPSTSTSMNWTLINTSTGYESLISSFSLSSGPPATSGRIFYIDNSAAGCGGAGCSDSNNGTSKATAWKHAPGMPDCTATCATIDNNSGNAGNARPGDQFVLRGGDIWHYKNGDLPWTWRSSGVSGNVIYIGVDKTWYVGTSWTRPVLNLDGQNIFSVESGAAFRFGGSGQAEYNTVDNLEFTNWSWTGACGGSCIYGPFVFSKGAPSNYDGNTLENSYFHGWTHTYNSGDTDGCVLVYGQSSNVLYNVFDGSDSSGGGDSCYAVYFAGSDSNSEIAYNYIYGTANGFVGSYPKVHDNTIAFIAQGYAQITSGSYHGNALENNSCNSPCFIYNNVSLNVTPAAGVTFWDAPTGTDYIFNNVIVNTTDGNVFDTQTGSGAQAHGGFVQMFNNTVECGHDSTPPASICSGDSAPSSPGSTWENNHWVTSAAQPIQQLGTEMNNTTQSKSAANGQGYLLSQSNAFSPTSSNGSTVRSGLNLESLCTIVSSLNAAAGTACLSDTTYGVSYNSTNHTVSWPARTPIARPASGAWDIGAYQWSSSQVQVVQPPTGLQAAVQ